MFLKMVRIFHATLFCFLTTISFAQITYIVNSTDDTDDGFCNTTHCSLREAINRANSDNVQSIINFNIPGIGPHNINITNNLNLTSVDGDIINGLTQNGNNPNNGLIILDASGSNLDHIGMLRLLNSSKWIIQGLQFQNSVKGLIDHTNSTETLLQHNIFEYSGNSFFALYMVSGNAILKNNIIRNQTNSIFISSNAMVLFESNSFSCNNTPLFFQNGANGSIPTPLINVATNQIVEGTSLPNSIIQLYYSENNSCLNKPCQGSVLIGSILSDNLGNWEMNNLNLIENEKITATATKSNLGTSNFSSCKEIINTTINNQPASNNICVYFVNNLDNTNDGICNEIHCSLKEAIVASNNDGKHSEIYFDTIGTINTFFGPNTNLPQPNEDSLSIYGENKIILNGNNSDYNGLVLRGKGKYVNGITFKNYTQSGVTIDSYLDSNSVVIIDECTFIDNHTQNIKTNFDFGNHEIKNSNFLGGWNGIYINDFDGVMTIQNNSFEGQKDAGIHLRETVKDVFITQNSFNSLYVSMIFFNISNVQLDKNSFSCNSGAIINYFPSYIPSNPTIDSLNNHSLFGTGIANDILEIHRSNVDCDGSYEIQPNEYIDTVVVDNNGIWTYNKIDSFNAKDIIQIMSKGYIKINSHLSQPFIILPDYCKYSESLPINLDPCSTVGAVMDMTQLTNSTAPINPSCSSTYAGNDAWYTITIPLSGNVLVRANLDNTIVPVIQAYEGDCDNLTPLDCQELDSLPYSMVFEDYTPGNKIYLRVWDKDNTITNSGNTALLHLTAHELDSIPNNWVVCDEQNNLLDNPTVLSKKDANTFIMEYDTGITPAEIAAVEAQMVADNLSLKDQCLCNSNPLQLWSASNPVIMEGLKRRSSVRTKVDTANYNYIFENIEFQVNSYAIGQQYDTDVSMDAAGNFVMVWVDEQRKHNYGRFYGSSGNPLVPEFRIGAADKFQYDSRVTTLKDGNFLAVWHQSEGNNFSTWGRTFTWDGADVIRNDIFSISADASNASSFTSELKEIAAIGTNTDVAFDGDNSVAVLWNTGSYIFLQRYDAAMTKVGQAQQVGTTVDNSFQPNTAIDMNGLGSFVITWEAIDNDGTGIYVQRYSNLGVSIGSPILANNYESGDQGHPEVSIADDGSFIVTWESYEQEGAGLNYGIYAQRFDASGTKIGGEIHVNSYTADKQRTPAITSFDDGTFYISWSSFGQDGYEEGIYGQVFAADGTPIDNEFQVNVFTDPEQEKPRTANNGENLFITAWEDGGNDGSYKGIFAQRYEILTIGGQKKFYPIGTTTPSTLLGEGLAFPTTTYAPTDNISTVRVAIVDTGIDIDHPRLVGSLWSNAQANDGDNCHLLDEIGYDFVNEDGVPEDLDGHGTQVAGIISRNFNTDVKLEIMNLKFHERGRGTVFDAICAIYYAVDNGADVINLSWGFEASEEPAILRKALQYASDNDVLIVTTAGNTSKNLDKISKYPANLDIDNMIVVTSYQLESLTLNKKLSNYACYGANNVDIAAYGFVETTTLGDSLTQSAGTSLAAPFVARTAATIRGLYPMLTATDIKDCILNTAEVDAALTGKVLTNGILNHDGALACAHDKAMACLGIDILVTVDQTNDSLYQTDSYITSSSDIIANLNLDYKAAQHITMNPGFCIAPGTIFNAIIEDCNPSIDPPALSAMNDEIQYFKINQHSSNKGKVITRFYVDSPQEIAMDITNSNGQKIDEWTASISKAGWYEKIIDVQSLQAQDYSLNFNLNKQLIDKKLRVIKKVDR